MCTAREVLHLPLEALRGRDGNTAVQVKCAWRGSPVFVASVTLTRLQTLLEETVEGGTALLHFTLAGGVDTAPSGAAFTTLTCNGWWRCGDGDAAEAACPSHGEPSSPTKATICSSPACDTVPEVREEVPSFLAILKNRDWVVPDSELRHPQCGPECCGDEPEIDLGDPSSLTLLRELLNTKVPEDDTKAPASSSQALM